MHLRVVLPSIITLIINYPLHTQYRSYTLFASMFLPYIHFKVHAAAFTAQLRLTVGSSSVTSRNVFTPPTTNVIPSHFKHALFTTLKETCKFLLQLLN